jgi:hypothetical protein
VSAKSERQAAREAVAAYHAARLAELLERTGQAIVSFRAGELDAFTADRVLYQYSRSAKELWKFCNLADAEMTAQVVLDRPLIDWWGRGALKRP